MHTLLRTVNDGLLVLIKSINLVGLQYSYTDTIWIIFTDKNFLHALFSTYYTQNT